MGDDSFTLISKREIEKLKSENKELKEKISQVPKQSKDVYSDNKDFIDEIIKAIHDESQKERKAIISELNSVKEINKSTLNNVLDHTKKVEVRLNDLIEIIKDFNSNVNNLVEVIHSGKRIDDFDSGKLIKEIKDAVALNNDLEINSISDKIDNISDFIENLKFQASNK